MSVLGVLALMSAHSDMSLTRHSAQVIEAVYELNAAAEDITEAAAAEEVAEVPAESEEQELTGESE